MNSTIIRNSGRRIRPEPRSPSPENMSANVAPPDSGTTRHMMGARCAAGLRGPLMAGASFGAPIWRTMTGACSMTSAIRATAETRGQTMASVALAPPILPQGPTATPARATLGVATGADLGTIGSFGTPSATDLPFTFAMSTFCDCPQLQHLMTATYLPE